MSGQVLIERLAQHLRHVRFERSLKLAPGRLDADRFVLVCDDPEAHLPVRDALVADVLRHFPPPEPSRHTITAALSAAALLHFGHESLPDGRSLIKAYAEREGADYSGERDVEPLGVAHKWIPGTEGSHVETRYRLVSRHWWTRRELLATAFCSQFSRPVTAAVERLLAAVLDGVTDAAAPPMLIESDESGGSRRRAFTLRLHDEQIRVGTLMPALAEVATVIGAAPAEAIEQTLEPALDGRVSFLAAGQDRQGDPFTTLYFDWQTLDLRPPTSATAP